jgi:inner membrane protein
LDSLTQIVLGASVAEAVAGRKFGNKALLWGAIAGTIPDLDVFLRFLYHPIEASLVHRGFSHSLLFAFFLSPILAHFISKLYRSENEYKSWLYLFFAAIVTHPILDMFTNYGTQFLWPLDTRISFNTIFVLDPLYTVPFALCVFTCLFLRRGSKIRKKINLSGLSYSCVYLIWGVAIKLFILSNSESYFKEAGIDNTKRIMVKPMPLTSFYWNIIGENENEFVLGYKSIFYSFDPKDIQIISKRNHIPINKLKWQGKDYSNQLRLFCNDYGFVTRKDSSLYFFDLRFGVSTMLTNKNNQDPFFGYKLQTNKAGEIIQTTPYRPRKLWSEIDFDNYLNQIFNK